MSNIKELHNPYAYIEDEKEEYDDSPFTLMKASDIIEEVGVINFLNELETYVNCPYTKSVLVDVVNAYMNGLEKEYKPYK